MEKEDLSAFRYMDEQRFMRCDYADGGIGSKLILFHLVLKLICIMYEYNLNCFTFNI